ncbi:MAG: enoyl-CoA hydratase/isomerase family protein [Bacteroidota bacterium]
MSFSSFDHLQVHPREGGYFVIQLSRGRANPMNADLVRELRQAIGQAQANADCKGLVLAGQEGFFSVGLDVIELYGYDKATILAFWQNFLQLLEDMLAFPKPLVAAITGHSPAGGCVLAIGCDYRVMAEGDKFQIGLNEIPVGIMLPEAIFEVYRFWIGDRKAYQFLMEGKLLSPTEAHEVGLVDEVVALPDVLATAEKQVQKYLKFEANTWRKSKMNLRRDLLHRLSNSEEADREAQIQQALDHWWSPEARAVLGGLVKHLQKRG